MAREKRGRVLVRKYNIKLLFLLERLRGPSFRSSITSVLFGPGTLRR